MGVKPSREFSRSARFLHAGQGFTPAAEATFFMTSPAPMAVRMGKGIFLI
jgi:hypothetical protein